MACLDDYINVKGYCGSNTPSSNLYINVNLPGITIEKAANTAEGAITTGVALLNQSILNGISRTRQDLINAMLGRVRFNQIISGGEYGHYEPDDFDDNTKYLSGIATSRGLKTELKSCCRLASMYVHRVGVIGKGSGTKTLIVTDGITDHTYSFTLSNQVITWVEVKKEIKCDLGFIRIADATFQPLDTTLNYSGSCGFCSNSCCGESDCSCSNGVNVYGWDGTNTGSQTFGLIPVIQVVCLPEKFFCEISHLEMVSWAVLYAAGIDFLNYNILTSRVNVYTIYDDEQAKETILDWEAKYQAKLHTISETLPKYLNSIDSCCIECNASTWEYSHP